MLKSIFDLPTSKDDLEAVNQGFASWKWLQKSPLRNLSDTDNADNFAGGEITYRWDAASSTWFMPSKCFLRARVKLARGDGSPLYQNDGIAPSMGLLANLFNECSVTINDQTVSLCDRHIGEIESMWYRINKSGQWMRDCGQSVNFWEPSFEKRLADVSNDGLRGEVVGNCSSPLITDRADLGYNAAVQVQINDGLGYECEFIGGNVATLDVQQIWEPGDLLVIQVDGEVFKRVFFVMEIVAVAAGAHEIRIGTTGVSLAAAIPAGVHSFERWRYAQPIVSENLFLDTIGRPVDTILDANNVLTSAAADYRQFPMGEFYAFTENNNDRYYVVPFSGILADDAATAAGPSFRVTAGNPDFGESRFIHYPYSVTTPATDLDYENSAAGANGHAVDIAPTNAAGVTILTITRIGTGGELPLVQNSFQIGDWVVCRLTADNTWFTGLVTQVDPSGNGRSLGVIGSHNLPAARGDATDATNYIYSRIRPGEKAPPLVSTNYARQLTEFEIIWTPRCLSFFRLPHALPGGAKFEFKLTPKNQYKIAAIESLDEKLSTGNDKDYIFQVKNMFFYVPSFEGKPMIEKTQFYLDMNEMRCTKNEITSQETSYTLNVRPSTNALAVAFQSSTTDNSTIISSSKYKTLTQFEESLYSFHIRYGAEQKPIPDFDMEADDQLSREFWTEIYARNLLATSAYFDGSTESIIEYFINGPYLYQIWNRDGSDRETRVYVKLGFNDALPDQQNYLLLFNFYKKYGIVRIENGRYQEVLINEA